MCICRKVVDDVAAEPTTVLILQIQRQVPVVESHAGLDSILDTGIDHIIVMSKSQLIDWAISERHNPRPANREGVRLNTQRSNAGDILNKSVQISSKGRNLLTLLVQIILIICNISRLIRNTIPRHPMQQHIPNARPPPFILSSSLHLIRSTSKSPPEPSWKLPALILGYQWDLLP